jgi:tRNA(Ile)-lysidine synthase
VSAAALDRETIERACGLSETAPILVALSGGGDSVALIHLLLDALGADRLHAIIVDHRLRADSESDARRAAAFAAALGVAHETIALDWPNGAKPSQASARRERYGVLCERARALGASVIATGHTRDDQAETVMLRAQANSSWRGLVGMRAVAPAPLWPEGRGLWIARPLLKARRAALRDVLRARAVGWIEDPSNDNPHFARVRVRTRLAELAAQGFDTMRLADLAERLRPLAERVDHDAAAIAARATCVDGVIDVTWSAWRGGVEARRRALSALLAAAAGADREAGADAVAPLEADLHHGFRGATLGGARLTPRRDGFRLERDRGALQGRSGGVAPLAALPLPAGREMVWDGRLALRAAEDGWSAVVGPDGGAVLTKSDAILPLVEAESVGVATVRWLNLERLAHCFGVHRAVTASMA